VTVIERATKRDWIGPLVFVVLGIIGAIVAKTFFFQAFPEASIDLKLSRADVAQRSEQWLRGRGFVPDPFRHVTVFDFDDEAKTYLERELGLEEANRVMASRVSIWRWRTRWIHPPAKEEFSVWFTTAGAFAGFEHLVEEEREGAKLSKDEAQRIAEVFLRAERGVDLARYELVTDQVDERPKRLDYVFTWQERDFRLRDARLRMSVTVLGDQVGGFREYLKIPEQWVRDYERLRSRNNLLQIIATVVYLILFIAAVVTIFRSRGRRTSLIAMLGLSGVIAALYMADFWNQFGLNTRIMPTNITYDVWTVLYLVGMLLLGLLVAFYVLCLAAAGEPLYREMQPGKVSLGHLFTFRGMRTKEFFFSTIVGYGMAAMHIGLVVLFYVVARRLGAWAPLDVNYNNAISTALPWLSPLSTSMFAASTEEFAFRLFAIPLLLKWTKNKWIAIVLPAFAWGFLHTAYPQQPAWIRGVEVGMIGVVAGWVFVRFGILATLVWHYTVDAVLIGMFLLRSENLGYKMAGAIVGDAVLLPLVIAGVFYLQTRGFLRDETILNGAPEAEDEFDVPEPVEPVVSPAPGELVPEAESAFPFLSPSTLVRLAIAAVLGIAALVAIDVPRVGDEIQIRAGAQRAEAIAVDHLQKRGVPVERYLRVTWLENDIGGSQADYLVERRGTRWTAKVYGSRVPAVFWRTRFFRPLEKEEYSVFVTPEGNLARVAHQLDEKAAGARLEKPQALARAQQFLIQNADRARVRLADYRLVEHQLEKRDARNDHTLVWEENQKLVGEAAHRITVAVRGDEPNGPLHTIKLPEEWQRLHTRPTLFTVMPVILIVLLVVAGVVLFARGVSNVRVRWRAHVWLGIVATLFQLAIFLVSIPELKQNMVTSVPWGTSMTIFVLGGILSSLFSGGAVTMLAAAIETLLTDRFGPLSFWPRTSAARGRALLEGLTAGAAAAVTVGGVRALIDWGKERVPSAVRGVSTGLPSFDASLSPSLAMVVRSLYGAMWQTLLLGGVAAVLLRLFRDRRALVAALIVGTALMVSGALDGTMFAKNWIAMLVSTSVMGAIVAALRTNVAAYLTMFFVISVVSRLGALLEHPGMRGPAIVALMVLGAIVAAVAVWGFVLRGRKGSEPAVAAWMR
jgi:membrane protease YdiL (CAAX protease family)